MKVTYIGHSGFFVELEKSWLLFDYYRGRIPAFPEGKAGYVFASHRHIDHFNKEIFKLTKKQKDIHFVLSDDIWEKRIPEDLQKQTVRMKPDSDLELGGIRIHTLRSTDEGVAFLVEAESQIIYHAGDLNHWYWEEEPDSWNEEMTKNFHQFIEPLRGQKIDAAFVPLDVRQGAYYNLGMDYFLELTEAKRVYPMHFWGHPEIIERWQEEHPHHPKRESIVKITEDGEVFEQ